MKWPDGRTYSGNFKNGLEDGSVTDYFIELVLFLFCFVTEEYHRKHKKRKISL